MLRSFSGVAALACIALAACRDASGGPAPLVIVPNAAGSNGCSGPDQVFVAPQLPVDVTPPGLAIGPSSQVTAAAGGELLYVTLDGASIASIDMSQAPPVVEVIVPPGSGAGTFEELLAAEQIGSPGSLSGIAVLDADTLLVVEQTSNTLVTVDRTSHALAIYAGQADETPGRVDGAAGLARFSFGTSTQICPTGDVPPKVFVADAGNHAIRLITPVPNPPNGFVLVVSTLAGNGAPGAGDGDIGSVQLDTPAGLSAACSGALIVSELGGHGSGHRILQLEIGQPSPFGGFFGTATTLAGTDTPGSVEGYEPDGEPNPPDAQVSAPASPLVTAEGEVYWMDAGTGVLRRRALDGFCDCPLTADCSVASFPPAHLYSLTQTRSGVLYVMDATDGMLYRVTP